MCNTHTEDAKATIAQIHALEEAGCEIVRVTVPNMEAAHALSEIKENISSRWSRTFTLTIALPWKRRRAARIRSASTPATSGEDRVKAVVDCCRAHKGAHSHRCKWRLIGKGLLEKYGRVTPEALVESALGHVALLEKYDFTDICLSVKSSDVPLNMAAYRLLLHERWTIRCISV